MAKITITGEAVVVTSALRLDDIRTIAKYCPDALVLKGGEDGKEPVFRLGVTNGDGNINQYGAEFNGETRDENKYAVITLVRKGKEANVCEAVADELGSAILNLNKLEKKLPGVLTEIADEKAAVIENITVVQ